MFSGWKSYYEIEPEVASDIDHYKITFPLEKDVIPEKVSEKTSEKILREVQKNQHVTIAALSEIIGVTPRSIERNIQKLRVEGVFQRVGPDKGGHWEVVDR